MGGDHLSVFSGAKSLKLLWHRINRQCPTNLETRLGEDIGNVPDLCQFVRTVN